MPHASPWILDVTQARRDASPRHQRCVSGNGLCDTQQRNTEGTEVRVPDIYIDGTWLSAQASGQREIRCPADGQLVATVDEAGPEDTAAAIGAARRAFDSTLR